MIGWGRGVVVIGRWVGRLLRSLLLAGFPGTGVARSRAGHRENFGHQERGKDGRRGKGRVQIRSMCRGRCELSCGVVCVPWGGMVVLWCDLFVVCEEDAYDCR